jgi:hypothetical protein
MRLVGHAKCGIAKGAELRKSLPIAGVLMMLSAPVSIAAEPVSVVIDELRCFHVPEVTDALEALRVEGFLVGDFEGYDSVSCWPLREPIRIYGIDFIRLCASHSETEVIQAHPDIYWRGPGTGPETGISLLTTDTNALTRLDTFGSDDLVIKDDYFYEDEIAVRCDP